MAGIKKFAFSPQLKELRIHLCQNSQASKGVRTFIEKYYVSIKQTNPKTPILIRECKDVEPALWARFDLGKEERVGLTGLGAEEIFKKVETYSK